MSDDNDYAALRPVCGAFSALVWVFAPPESVGRASFSDLWAIQAIFHAVWLVQLDEPNRVEKAGHDATNLPRGDRTLCAFPGISARQTQLFGKQQQIAGTRHDPTPAFHLLRRAQMRLCPEQVLLEKAIAVLLREMLAIPTAHQALKLLTANNPLIDDCSAAPFLVETNELLAFPFPTELMSCFQGIAAHPCECLMICQHCTDRPTNVRR